MSDTDDPEDLGSGVSTFKSKTSTAQADYNRAYYLKNKNRIAKRKDNRYKNDPEYRAGILANRAKQREEEKAERAKAKALETAPKAEKPGKKMQLKIRDDLKVMAEMLTIGQAAFRLGLAIQTLRKWEKMNVLPEALYRSKGGQRLYTADQVAVIGEVYARFKAATSKWVLTDEFTLALHTALAALTSGVKIKERTS